MYRKRFEPQLSRLPDNYCGWAAETKVTATEKDCGCETPPLPCPAKKECGTPGNELSDIILIGAVIAFLLFMKDDAKPDISLLVPLAILLFTK